MSEANIVPRLAATASKNVNNLCFISVALYSCRAQLLIILQFIIWLFGILRYIVN